MSPQEERIYFIGGTGGVGNKAVQDVLDAGYKITIYSRQPEKSSFNNNPNVTFVQGDYNDFTPFEQSIKGHSRLFLLVANLGDMPRIKGTLAKIAYASGVQQVVDVSSLTIDVCNSTAIGQAHYRAEEAIRAVKKDTSSYVAIRPWRFMSNHIWEQQGIKALGAITGVASSDCVQGWISPNDIGALAAVVLTEPIEKHGDAIYPMTGEMLTPAQRADSFSKSFGISVGYKQISIKEQYDILTSAGHFPHKICYDFAQSTEPDYNHSPGLFLLLGREPETLEQWLAKNKAAFQLLLS
ncbi:hypothetical protein BDA99DRAFT_521156 [Phascolomyces articulosus]|uniref:NmrA-like domain-containing protein n=1 Tax=Phascolomyces articulosus TaxID=60185 RepID=A0AAD5PAB2_9FUNG|nr:hypothetical protein BDA99DRAFT_521156 [Phascolomyces articulosus]